MNGPTPLRIAMLGASKIAPHALIAPAKTNARIVVHGVAARDRERANAYAREHDVPQVFADYETLLASPDIDAVYNSLPPSRHADLTIAALKAGKHVLCEKPFAMNTAEALAMVQAAQANGRVLMEAFHYRFHPMFTAILQTARERLGALTHIEAAFCVPIAQKPGELRYDPALGGGALMDLGTYCVHWCRTIAGREPKVIGASQRLTEAGADLASDAELDFGGGLRATIACAMDSGPRAELIVHSEAGSLTALNPLAPQMGHMLTLKTPDGEEAFTFTRDATYDFQLNAFVDAVQQGTPALTGGDDAIAQMVIIDAIKAAARAAR